MYAACFAPHVSRGGPDFLFFMQVQACTHHIVVYPFRSLSIFFSYAHVVQVKYASKTLDVAPLTHRSVVINDVSEWGGGDGAKGAVFSNAIFPLACYACKSAGNAQNTRARP